MNSKQGNIFIQDKYQRDEEQQQLEDKEVPEVNVVNQRHQLNNQQLDRLLDEETQQKQQIVLRFKLNELQKICNSLTKTNNKLIEKVTALEEEKENHFNTCSNQNSNLDKSQNISVDEYSELNNQFVDLEAVIKQYKSQLEVFRKTMLVEIKNKQQKISKYKAEGRENAENYRRLLLQKQDIQKLNKQLETRNQGLILEIQNLQKQKSKLEQKVQSIMQRQHTYTNPNISSQNRYDHNHSHSNQSEYELPNQIQNQYEILIERLVKQLEYEKNIKKKMGEEIKRMSQQLMESEREIMSKNKKLYEIEMKLLRNTKATAQNTINYSKIKGQDHNNMRLNFSSRYDSLQRYNNNSSGNGAVSNSRGKNNGTKNQKNENKLGFKPFVLLELINGELQEEVSNPERKVIGIKIIQFYQRKIERDDFSNVNPENLLVWNFSHKRPQLCSIRKVGTSVYEQGEKTEESLVWNLAFILDNLFSQNQGIQDFDEILEITGQVLEKQLDNNKEAIQCMKQILCL